MTLHLNIPMGLDSTKISKLNKSHLDYKSHPVSVCEFPCKKEQLLNREIRQYEKGMLPSVGPSTDPTAYLLHVAGQVVVNLLHGCQIGAKQTQLAAGERRGLRTLSIRVYRY